MNQNREIAAALGKEFWSTDSFIPEYRCGEMGSWRIDPGGQLVNDWGYYSKNSLLEMLPSLARKVPSKTSADSDGWETWMSLTPHEIESQELGFLHAFKNVVVMGLGMGWIAANIAIKSNVEQVIIVERDPDVIRLFHDSGAFQSLPPTAQQKIVIANEDAMKWRPNSGTTIDFLYADIWLHLAEPQTMRQVQQMQDNVKASTIYFWGQELAIYSAIKRNSQADFTITDDAIRAAVTDSIELPLLIPDDRNYALMIEQVVQNRIDRRLPVETSAG